MAFTAGQSFTFGEQPSTTKWNYLWNNDYALQDWTAYTNGTFPASLYDSNADALGWVEIGRHTLGADADKLDVSSLPNYKHLKLLISLFTTGQIGADLTLNNDSGANYSRRASFNGGAESSLTSQNEIVLFGAGTQAVHAYTIEIHNLASYEKILIGHGSRSVSGAGSSPDKFEFMGKWANTAAAISQIEIDNSGTGDFETGSELIVLGKS